MNRSGGRVGLRDESQGVGAFCRRHRVEPPPRPGHARLAPQAGQGPLGATRAKHAAGKSALRLTSLSQRSSMGLAEGIARVRHGLSTFNPLEEDKEPNQCDNFFIEAGLLCLDANENRGPGTMLIQTPCDSLAESGQGSAA